jgi:hypothetical protein
LASNNAKRRTLFLKGVSAEAFSVEDSQGTTTSLAPKRVLWLRRIPRKWGVEWERS